jgi:hypothetical protein
MANDHLPEEQVLSSKGLSPHALQAIRFSRVYGAVFEYSVLDSQSTWSNLDLLWKLRRVLAATFPISRHSNNTSKWNYFRLARPPELADTSGPLDTHRDGAPEY